MNEVISIIVERFRDPDGHPTCCRDVLQAHECRFLGSARLGQQPVCLITMRDLSRGPHDLRRGAYCLDPDGWIRPGIGCPVWPEEAP